MKSRLQDENKALTTVALATAFLMIANQTAGKATRDALFLSNYDVTVLPILLIVGSIVSIIAVFGVTRAMTQLGPQVFVPIAFGTSAIFLLLEWLLSFEYPRLAAVALYVHFAAFGSVLVSGFWSLINERFDPRSGKRMISRIATGATLGGLSGGLLTERIAVISSITTMLPILASMHVVCALLLLSGIKSEKQSISLRQPTTKSQASGLKTLKKQPYLRSMAALVLLGTVSASLIDYVFKAQASSAYTSPETLLRFFAIYYTAVGLLTVVFQGGFARTCLQRFGLVKVVASLPAVTSMTALFALIWPGLGTITLARSSEGVVRNSLYRSAYELLYTPVPKAEKRATKSLIDVGFERLGDALGGGLLKALLLVIPAIAQPIMLILAVLLGSASIAVSVVLNRGYVLTLERNLKRRALALDVADIDDDLTKSVVLNLNKFEEDPLKSFVFDRPPAAAITKAKTAAPGFAKVKESPEVIKFMQLRSGDPSAIRKILAEEVLDPSLVEGVIQLLASDDLARDAILALRRNSSRFTGQLIDALLDQNHPDSIRRRIPRALGGALTQRSFDGLLLGMNDPKFEVRFQCGRALAYVKEGAPNVTVPSDRVFKLVMKEVNVKRAAWQSQQLLDQIASEEDRVDFFIDEFVKDRASRSLEHVFTLLTLSLPSDPLRIAYRGIHSGDKNLRGTGLEYMETVLPAEIWKTLRPFVELEAVAKPEPKSREKILEELFESDQSIQLSLEELKKLRGSGD